MKTIIAFDLGTKTGFAVRRGDEVLASGTFDFSPGRHSSPGMRFVHFGKQLTTLIKAYPDAVFVYEEVRRHLGTDAAHVYGGLLAILQSELTLRGLQFQGIPVGTIKKTATGKGNAGKDAMIAAARAKWPGIKIEDDNHADALWIAECGVAMIGGAS
jgi:Holliday junction resolvasome RuvABC endonuclease subunit